MSNLHNKLKSADLNKEQISYALILIQMGRNLNQAIEEAREYISIEEAFVSEMEVSYE